MSEGSQVEIVYRWPDGREEIRYRRMAGSESAEKLIAEVRALQKMHGEHCPYFVRESNSPTSGWPL